jgi:hypothetical protein
MGQEFVKFQEGLETARFSVAIGTEGESENSQSSLKWMPP